MKTHFTLASLGAALSLLLEVHAAGPAPTGAPSGGANSPPLGPNILIIVADDVGVDMVNVYGESGAAPCTPNLDALAQDGLLFRNAWACPVCSPTRAALLTGRHGFRTGIGNVVTNTDSGLALAETTLPELLSSYSSACIGKWHLSGAAGPFHPNDSGFQHFDGFLQGQVNSYSSWPRVVDGQASLSTVYTTIEFTDEAIVQINSLPQPWFVVVNYNAAHSPYQVPPASLCPVGACPNTWCSSATPASNDRRLARAMMESLDVKLGELVAAVDALSSKSYVFFLGDNGTPPTVSINPFTAAHAKGTLYEGGVNVPLIVRGPTVRRGECEALVSVTDIYATVAQLAGAPSQAEDSISLTPHFAQRLRSLRPWVYTELFSPNGGSLPFTQHTRAIRDERYKLIRRTGAADEFYDLELDPFETVNLFGSLTAAQQQRYNALVAELFALGVG